MQRTEESVLQLQRPHIQVPRSLLVHSTSVGPSLEEIRRKQTANKNDETSRCDYDANVYYKLNTDYITLHIMYIYFLSMYIYNYVG